MGKYDIEVTTYQMAVLFAWNERPTERISFENLRLTTTLTDAELNRTLLVGVRRIRNDGSYILENNFTFLVAGQLPEVEEPNPIDGRRARRPSSADHKSEVLQRFYPVLDQSKFFCYKGLLLAGLCLKSPGPNLIRKSNILK